VPPLFKEAAPAQLLIREVLMLETRNGSLLTHGQAVVRNAPGLTILGTGSGCGKTWHVVALLKAIRLRGGHPVPFKPISVVDLDDVTSGDPRPWARAIHHHLMAAGLPYDVDYNPLVVVPVSESEGTLFLRGRKRSAVNLNGPDQVDFASMDEALFAECAAVIEDSLGACRASGTFVLLEGSGDSGLPRQGPPDLANSLAVSAAGYPAISVFRPGGTRYASLDEYRRRLGPEVASLLKAVVVNNPSGHALPPDLADFALPVGLSSSVELPHSDGSVIQQRNRHEVLAEHVWRTFPWASWVPAIDPQAGCLPDLVPARLSLQGGN